MKNVFKRLVLLINLFNDNSLTTTQFIKDNIEDYRNLSDAAFRRSFERDKSLLKEFGYSLRYSNDKWDIEKGYYLDGNFLINKIQKKLDDEEYQNFFSTYIYLKNQLKFEKNLTINLDKIGTINQAINEGKRIGFDYLNKYRKVKPLGFRYSYNNWYLAAYDGKSFKTFLLSNVENIKSGNIPNLFENDINEYNFSWEDTKNEFKATFMTKSAIYKANKNLFKHKIVSANDDETYIEVEILSDDYLGFYKFLLQACNDVKVLHLSTSDFMDKVFNE